MKILDVDMDYFMKCDVHIYSDSYPDRLSEEEYKAYLWSEKEVRDFFEHNLGLKKEKKIPGRIVVGHNEALYFWQELISLGKLTVPFDVVHVDTHADLGIGYRSWNHICRELLSYPVEERPRYSQHIEGEKEIRKESIGDYLLFAIAYRMISSLTYCGNPYKQCNDYYLVTLKNFKEEYVKQNGDVVTNTIQLLYNTDYFPDLNSTDEYVQSDFINNSIKEPEVPFIIIPSIDDVSYKGDFDFAVMAQSPNYTLESADFIMDVFRDYIVEI